MAVVQVSASAETPADSSWLGQCRWKLTATVVKRLVHLKFECKKNGTLLPEVLVASYVKNWRRLVLEGEQLCVALAA